MGLKKELEANLKKIHLFSLKEIEKKVQDYDMAKSFGDLWVSRGYGRSYSLDKITPYYLSLRMGPQEKEVCPAINFFLEEIDDKINITNVNTNPHSIKIFTDGYIQLIFIPKKLKSCIITEEKEFIEKRTVSKVIC